MPADNENWVIGDPNGTMYASKSYTQTGSYITVYEYQLYPDGITNITAMSGNGLILRKYLWESHNALRGYLRCFVFPKGLTIADWSLFKRCPTGYLGWLNGTSNKYLIDLEG